MISELLFQHLENVKTVCSHGQEKWGKNCEKGEPRQFGTLVWWEGKKGNQFVEDGMSTY